jgi:hypothetical protein
MPDVTLAATVLVTTPLLAFAGSFLGHLLARKGAKELDRWRRREETMRMLRWAAEKAVDHDQRIAEIGMTALTALAGSELLQQEDRDLIDAVTQAAVGDTLELVDPDDSAVTEG